MTDEVREFYDDFAGRVLLQDFLRPNARHDAIKKLCDTHIRPGSKVLEIGCGAGIITKHLSATASKVFSIDISENNVQLATMYAGGANVELAVVDVIEQPQALDRLAPFDAVLLADVIEHIPVDKHPAVFASIERVLGDGGLVLLTYPSPEYQQHLTQHDPESRQVIDETVELRELLAATSLRPLSFNYRSIFHENQYVHLVLSRPRRFEPRPVQDGLWGRIRFKLRKLLWRNRHAAFVRRAEKHLSESGEAP